MNSQMIAVRRCLKLMEALSRQPQGLSFKEIALLFPDAPASTVSRLLKVLLEEEVMRQTPEGSYQAAGRFDRLARNWVLAYELGHEVAGFVERLARLTGQSAAFFRFIGDGAQLLKKYEMPEAFHYMPEGGVNQNFLTHGFALMGCAWQPLEVQRRLVARCRHMVDVEDVFQRLREIREAGLIVNERDDKEGVVRIVGSVAVQGRLLGMLGISFFAVPAVRSRIGQWREAVATVCHDLEEYLKQYA